MDAQNNPTQNGPAADAVPEGASLHSNPTQPPDDTKREGTSKSLAASLGFASWPYSDDALINALRVKAEHERTKQEFFRFESNKRVLEILDAASRLGIPGHVMPVLFSGNDEMAKRALMQFAGTPSRLENQDQDRSTQQQKQPLVPSAAGFPMKSPRTPVRPGGASRSPSQSMLGTVQESSNLSTPSVQTHIMEPRSQPPPQHRHSLSFDSSRESPERFIPGHMSTVSALPTFGPLSPSVFPGGSPHGRPVVPGGFYPAHLASPRLPQLHQSHTTSPRQATQPMGLQIPSLAVPVPGSSQYSGPVPVPIVQSPSSSQYPQQQSQQSQPPPQPQLTAQPGQVQLAGQTRLSASPTQSPINYSVPSQPPRQQQPVAPPHAQVHQQASLSQQDRSSSTQTQSRPLIPVLNTAGPRGGRRGGHKHSLSTGADLQIHQWKPKQLLRDNRWKISNPFSKSKDRKGDDQQSAEKQGGEKEGVEKQPAENKGPENKGPENKGPENKGPENKGPENKGSAVEGAGSEYKPSAPAKQGARPSESDSSRSAPSDDTTPAAKRLSAGFRSPPPAPPPVTSTSSAAVVAAQNNRRRSMTHARQRSRTSVSGSDAVPYAPVDDAKRHSEGVAVLASLATEQDRRDRQEDDAPRGSSDSTAAQPPASQ